MAHLTARRGNGDQPHAPSYRERLRAMRNLLRWPPFREAAPAAPSTANVTFSPDFEVRETGHGYEIRADVPGIAEKDLDISCSGHLLRVSGKRDAEKERKGETFYVHERSYGAFARSFSLPASIDADHIQADLRDGVLTVLVPKKPEARAKTIPIESGEKAGT